MSFELLSIHQSFFELTSGTGNVGFPVFQLLSAILVLAGLWGIYLKAKKPGWHCVVPVRSELTLLAVTERPRWWAVLLLLPLLPLLMLAWADVDAIAAFYVMAMAVSGITQIVVLIGLVEHFRKGLGWVFGVLFLPMIFVPILGFGRAEYHPRYRRRTRRRTG